MIPHAPRPGLVVGRDRRRAWCWPARWSPAGSCCSTTRRSSTSRPTSRDTPTTSPLPSTAASRSPAATDDALVRRPRRRRPADHRRRLRPADAGVETGGPRAAARRRCRTPTRRPTPAGPRCSWRRSPGSPEQLLAATEDRLHQDYREPAMPETLDLVRRAAGRRGPGRGLRCGPDRAGLRGHDADACVAGPAAGRRQAGRDSRALFVESERRRSRASLTARVRRTRPSGLGRTFVWMAPDSGRQPRIRPRGRARAGRLRRLRNWEGLT